MVVESLQHAAFAIFLFILAVAALVPLGAAGWSLWNVATAGTALSWWLAGGAISFSVVFYGFLYVVIR